MGIDNWTYGPISASNRAARWLASLLWIATWGASGCTTKSNPAITPSVPVKIGPLDPLPLAVGDITRLESAMAKFAQAIPPEGPADAVAAHLLRLFALDEARVDRASLLARFFDGRSLDRPTRPSDSLFYVNQGRVGYKLVSRGQSSSKDSPSHGEAHVGQFLATLGEAGVSPRREIILERGSYHVQDIVADTAERLSFDQEIEWRIMALAYYQPEVRAWRNRFGEEMSWAKITHELLDRVRSRAFRDSSCYGTHLIFTLATLYRIDEQVRIWDDVIRGEVEDGFRLVTRRMTDSQRGEGKWDRDWASDSQSNAVSFDPLESLLVTGHFLDYLALLPGRFRPNDIAIARAGHFVLVELEKLDPKELSASICHTSHGVRAYSLCDPKDVLLSTKK